LARKETIETTARQEQEAVSRQETPLESFASICSVLAIGIFIITFVFQNFEIPSSSMEKTILIGDHVLADRISLAPRSAWAPFVHYGDVHRGDIIVFIKPHETNLILVKRVIGLPGDRIHLEHGVVYINGVPQREPYAAMPADDGRPEDAYYPYRDDFPSVPPSMSEDVTATWAVDMSQYIHDGDLVVPADHYFAMGDNRLVSLDSRYWGFVPRQNILGRPLFIYWSFITSAGQEYKTSVSDRLSFMAHVVVHFFDQTRWRRTFRRVQ
jgi:signal peptidase I